MISLNSRHFRLIEIRPGSAVSLTTVTPRRVSPFPKKHVDQYDDSNQ